MSFETFGSYPAISLSTNVGIESSLLLPDYNLPGFSYQHSDRCNTPNYIEYCPDCGHTGVHSYHCNRWDCPVCYPWTAAKAARNASNRLWGVYQAWGNQGIDVGYLNHIVVSVPPSEYDNFDEKTAKKKMIKYAKQFGLSGGAVVFHPYRIIDEVEDVLRLVLQERGIKGGPWLGVHKNVLRFGYLDGRLIDSWLDYVEFAPHWHIVGYFKLKERSDSFESRTGWVYTNVSVSKYHAPLDRAGAKRTLAYLCTHHRVEKGKQSVTYFGIASPNKVKRDVSVEFKVAKCSVCYKGYKHLDLDNNVIGASSRGDLYRIPVRSSIHAEKLLDDIRYRRFKFKPEDYSKAWYPVVHYFYSVRTGFSRRAVPAEIVDDFSLACIPEATDEEKKAQAVYRNSLPAIDWENVNKHRVG
jgi:hypothetical protein